MRLHIASGMASEWRVGMRAAAMGVRWWWFRRRRICLAEIILTVVFVGSRDKWKRQWIWFKVTVARGCCWWHVWLVWARFEGSASWVGFVFSRWRSWYERWEKQTPFESPFSCFLVSGKLWRFWIVWLRLWYFWAYEELWVSWGWWIFDLPRKVILVWCLEWWWWW